jgi:hypothetical protein
MSKFLLGLLKKPSAAVIKRPIRRTMWGRRGGSPKRRSRKKPAAIAAVVQTAVDHRAVVAIISPSFF